MWLGGQKDTKLTFKNIQLEKGDTVTDYEPYGKYKIPLKVLGKNLFGYTAETVEEDSYKMTVNQDKSLTLDNYSMGLKYFNINSMNIDIIGGKKYNMTLGLTQELCSKIVFAIRFYDANNQLITNINTSSKTTVEFETPSNFLSYNAYITIQANTPEIEGLNLYPMVYDASLENVEYEPYKGQSFDIYLDEPLRKVGDVSDYIDSSIGKVVRKVGEIAFTGEENWYQYGSNVALSNWCNRTDIEKNSVHQYGYKSNIALESENGASETKNDNTFVTHNLENVNWIAYNINYDVEDWKQFLSDKYGDNNPVRVLYQLATPDSTETIELPEIIAYEDYTKIEVLTEVAPSKIEATYDGYTFE